MRPNPVRRGKSRPSRLSRRARGGAKSPNRHDLRNNHFQFAPRMKKAHEGLGKNSKKFQE
jgi:hypothetical protein